MVRKREPDPGPDRKALLARIEELERQLTSEEDLHALVQTVATHQEEMREQQVALIEAQHELEISRDRYADLYDFSPVPILTLDQNALLLSMNLAATRLLGQDRTHALRTPLVVYVHPDSRRAFMDHFARCRRAGDLVRDEIVLRSRDHKEVPVEIQTKRFEPTDAEGVSYQTVLIDQTERKRNEQERRRMEEERARIAREEITARAAS